LGGALCGEVVGGGPETAGHDAEVGADAGLEERPADVLAPVAHHHGTAKLESQRIKTRRCPGGVGVGDGAAHHLVAGDDELDDGRSAGCSSGHVSPKCDAAIWMPQVPAHAQTPAKRSSSTTP